MTADWVFQEEPLGQHGRHGASRRWRREFVQSRVLLSETGVDRLFRCVLLARARVAHSAGPRVRRVWTSCVLSDAGDPLHAGVAVSLPQTHRRCVSSVCPHRLLRLALSSRMESTFFLGSRIKHMLFIFLPDSEQGRDLHLTSL